MPPKLQNQHQKEARSCTVSQRLHMRIISLLLLLACENRILAQPGYVDFHNDLDSFVLNGISGLPVIRDDGILAALYYAPDGVTDENQFIFVGQAAVVGLFQPGIFPGGPTATPETTTAGDFAMFQVRAWEKDYGSTYAEAQTAAAKNGRQALVGTSDVLRVLTAYPLQVPTQLGLYGLQSFSVQLVPEPTVIPLVLLGAVLFGIHPLWIRYQRQR